MIREGPFPQAIHGSGRRMTRQRQLVMDVLDESQEHLDAEALYERVKARDPRIGLATVYRTLSLLKRIGLVEEHRLGEEHGHFESVPEQPHYHFTCQKCGRVIEFGASSVLDVVQSLSEEQGIQVTDVHVFLRGYCDRCRDKER